MKVTYHGHEVMTYMYYTDTATGKTLVCVPGESYDITPDDIPTDGRFTEVIVREKKSGVKSTTTSDAVTGGEE